MDLVELGDHPVLCPLSHKGERLPAIPLRLDPPPEFVDGLWLAPACRDPHPRAESGTW